MAVVNTGDLDVEHLVSRHCRVVQDGHRERQGCSAHGVDLAGKFKVHPLQRRVLRFEEDGEVDSGGEHGGTVPHNGEVVFGRGNHQVVSIERHSRHWGGGMAFTITYTP